MARKIHPDFRSIPYRWRLKYGYYQFFDHFLGRANFFKLTAKSRRRFYKKLGQYLKDGGVGKIIPVDRIENISQEDFISNYVKKGIPVVLTGKAKEWNCTRNWSLDYFKELHGDDTVIYVDQKNITEGNFTEITLGELMDNIKNGKSDYYRFYPLLKKHPEHLLDFDYKWLRSSRLKGSFGESFQVFIGGINGFTSLHNASAHNLFTQVYGEKKWRLYPNHYACIIDPDPINNLSRGAPIRNETVFNPFENDFSAHELYRYLDGYSVHLKPGDVFYNPSYMWHTVSNPSDSIGVGYRYFTPVKTYFESPLYQFLELFAFRPPIWKIWKNYDDVNMIHLAETGQLKKIAKDKGVKKITGTV